jgi:hypothetical protein
VRGFLAILLSVLLAIAAGVAVASLTSGSASDRIAESFAHRVFDEATIPPGARSTDRVVCSFLQGPMYTPGGISDPPLIDLHRLYLVDDSTSAVEGYLRSHLTRDAEMTVEGTAGSPSCLASNLIVSLPVSGPNQYFAQLGYDISPDGAGVEMRIDAEAVWLPNRSVNELVPAKGIIAVTGFTQAPLDDPSTGPVTVQLPSASAATLRRVINSLPRGPRVSQAACVEDPLLYRIVVRPAAGSAPSFEFDGYECAAEVFVTRNGRSMPPLYDAYCSLLHAVIKVLPAHEANGTRGSQPGCKPYTP